MIKAKPVWQDIKLKRFPKLRKSSQYDVVIIGGGITGLSTAYLLARAKLKVCLIERDRLASVATGHTTAHLTYVTDLRLSDLLKNYGQETTSLVLRAGFVAIDTIEDIVKRERIECQFRRVPGFLISPLDGRNDERALRANAKAAIKAGFDAAFISAAPFFQKPAVRFPDQAKFHPVAYLSGLVKAIEKLGGAIFEESEAGEVESEPLAVKVGSHRIECDYLVLATHTPLMGNTGLIRATLFQTKLSLYTTYAMGAKAPKDLLPEASFWDTSDPYYYLRVERGERSDYLIFGGEDHKTGQEPQTEERFARLEAMLHRFVPEAKVDRRWSGQVIETNDGLPFIGETADKQFAATGFAGNGMTFGTISALMARDAVLGNDNSWRELFSPKRKKIRGGTWEYIKENVDYPKHLVKDWLSPKEHTTRSVKRGEGQVLRLGGKLVACSRDEQGKLTKVSAVCTHMGCLVRWNEAESTWDCPCHGSRFHASGEALAGPAESPLSPVDA